MQQTSTGNNCSHLILGIETSCDETAAAIVHRTGPFSGEILANVVHSQLAEHAAFSGIVPEIAARAHVEILDEIINTAMAEASLELSDLDAVAVTAGPGLIGGLLVGLMTAKSIALVHKLPLIAVNHLEGHALTVGLTDGLAPPYLLLLISGGHTQTVIVHEVGRYERLGTTIDDALGEAFDKTAKLLGLGFPGGPEVEKWAAKGDPARFSLPRPMTGRPEPHFSFSGLKTALRYQAQALEPLSDQDIADLCASFSQAVAECIIDRLDLAISILGTKSTAQGRKTLVVAGGVAANAYLRLKIKELTASRDIALSIPPASLCTDNAAMIAWAGAERYARGWVDALDISARARWPLDHTAKAAIGAGTKA